MVDERTHKEMCVMPGRGRRLALAAAIALLAGTAVAADETPKYTMTVISNESHSGKVLKGDYAAAIDRLTVARVSKRNAFSSLTNLCVAYTKLGDLDKAEEACDGAVKLVEERRNERSRTARPLDAVEAADRADLAVALSNRGVYHAARGETQEAHDDFETSLELGAGLSAPEINLARLDRARHELY